MENAMSSPRLSIVHCTTERHRCKERDLSVHILDVFRNGRYVPPRVDSVQGVGIPLHHEPPFRSIHRAIQSGGNNERRGAPTLNFQKISVRTNRNEDAKKPASRRAEKRIRKHAEVIGWSRCPDSDWRPAHYECAALPTELHRRKKWRSH